MQKELTVLANEPSKFKIQAEWDVQTATFFTRELYQHANKGKISFELNARKGSLITEFTITVLEGIISAIIYDLIKTIFKLVKKNKEENKEAKPVYIFTEKEEYIITGDRDSKIPKELLEELLKEDGN